LTPVTDVACQGFTVQESL